MTTEPLLTISAFARAVDLAPSTLRYYDEAGLLPPAEVDARTGYRYYTPDLERRAALLRRMREIGLSLESMRAVLAGTPEQATRVLRSHVTGAQDSASRAAEVAEEVLAALTPHADAGSPVTVTVDGAEVAAALGRVARAAAADPGPLRGVLIDVAGGEVTVVATDRYWLACWRLPLAERSPGEIRGFLTLPEVERLAGLLAGIDTATLTMTDSELRVDTADGATVLPLADDRFPAYRLVLPPPPVGRATVSLTGLRTALGEDGPVRLAPSDGVLDVGGYADAPRVPLTAAVLGAPTTLWLARDLLLGALEALVGETVTIAWTDPVHAVRLTPVEQRRLDVVLMPLRPPV